MKDIYLTIFDWEKGKSFKKYFNSYFDRDKFANKLKYSYKLLVVGKDNNY